MSNARENVNLLTSADWDIAALRLANWGSGAVPPQVMLKQNWVAGDGGGLFRYDASDTTTADNGGTVIVDAANNRWKRQYEGPVWVEWFGARGDGGWTAVGGVTGTNDGPAIQAASDELEALGGGVLAFRARAYRSNQALVQSKGVTWQGAGTAHHAFWQTGGSRKGTVLLVVTPAAQWSFTSEGSIEGGVCIRDMSIYDAGVAALAGFCRIPARLHWQMENMEFGALNRDVGVGIFCERVGTTELTLYGVAKNVRVKRAEIALDIEGDSNANAFIACTFQGSRLTRRMRAEASLQPRAVAFFGCWFERAYEAAKATHRFVAANSAERQSIVSLAGSTACYVTPFQEIAASVNLTDVGCYYEDGGQSGANYTDGVNGSHPLVSVIDLTTSADVQSSSFLGCDWVNVYLRDNGTATRAEPYRGGVDYRTAVTPTGTIRKTSSQSVPAVTWTRVQLQTLIDSWRDQLEWDATNHVAICRSGGNYLIRGQVHYESMLAGADYVQARIVAGAKTFESQTARHSTTGPCTSQVVCVAELARGDTIALDTFQSSSGAQTVQGYPTLTSLNIAKL